MPSSMSMPILALICVSGVAGLPTIDQVPKAAEPCAAPCGLKTCGAVADVACATLSDAFGCACDGCCRTAASAASFEEPTGPHLELANRTHPGRGLEFATRPAVAPARATYSGGGGQGVLVDLKIDLYGSSPNCGQFGAGWEHVKRGGVVVPTGDLNQGLGGADYLWLCAKYKKDELLSGDDTVITKVRTMARDDRQYSCPGGDVIVGGCSSGTCEENDWPAVDLNKGASGKWIYLCFTRSERVGASPFRVGAVVDLMLVFEGTGIPGFEQAEIISAVLNSMQVFHGTGNLNEGASTSKDIRLLVKTKNSYCAENYHVDDGECKACREGASHPAGDDLTKGDTLCVCMKNERVKGGECVACPAGTLRDAGDQPADGATTCDLPVCTITRFKPANSFARNEKVVSPELIASGGWLEVPAFITEIPARLPSPILASWIRYQEFSLDEFGRPTTDGFSLCDAGAFDDTVTLTTTSEGLKNMCTLLG